MASPFPGMDPYLENPQHFRGVHLSLLFEIRRVLNRDLPPAYLCDVDEHVYVTPPRRDFSPDVLVSRIGDSKTGLEAVAVRTRLQTAEIVATEPIRITIAGEIIHRRFLEIRTANDARELITVIEVLSPTNKQKGEHQKQYHKKQDELLYADVNLLEIDLLRAGAYTVAVPQSSVLEQSSTFDYVVSLHRAERFWDFEAWAFTVRDLLPVVTVPLRTDEPDVLLNLSEVFVAVYDAWPYAREVNIYQTEAVPRLERETADWADALLREKGLRK